MIKTARAVSERTRSGRPQGVLGADSGFGKANLLLALLAAEGTENGVPVGKRRRPGRVHRAARIEAMVEIPDVPKLVEAVASDSLEPFIPVLHPVRRHQSAVLAIERVALGGRGA